MAHLDLFKVMFYGFYHGKSSPFNHHKRETIFGSLFRGSSIAIFGMLDFQGWEACWKIKKTQPGRGGKLES